MHTKSGVQQNQNKAVWNIHIKNGALILTIGVLVFTVMIYATNFLYVALNITSACDYVK